MARTHLSQENVISPANRNGDEIEGMGFSLGMNAIETILITKVSLSL